MNHGLSRISRALESVHNASRNPNTPYQGPSNYGSDKNMNGELSSGYGASGPSDVRTNKGTDQGGKTPDQPTVWFPPNDGSTDVDFRSLIDSSQACELKVCSMQDVAALQCARLASNLAPVIVNRGTKVIGWDFTQGGRTAKQAFELIHHLIAGRPIPRTYFPGVQLGVSGRFFAVGFATVFPDLLTAGITIQGAQTVLNASQPTIDIVAEGLDPNTGAIPAVTPLGYQRDVQIIRGFANRPIQLDLSGINWTAYLPHMWRAFSGMDVAMVDLARPSPLPDAVAALVRNTWAPGSTGRLYGMVSFISASSPLVDVRCYPMAGNSLRIGDMITALGG